MKATKSSRAAKLSKSMTETEFDNGYWYADDLKKFAEKIGVPSARRLRKDELERAVRHFLRSGEAESFAGRTLTKLGPRDIDLGLRLDLPVVHYTSNRQTKDFIEQEAAKLEPGFARKSGTRYLLNRWREEQLREGHRTTYGDLVRHAIELNRTKDGPLRVEHGRYINFISDFMKANKRAPMREAIAAWNVLKKLDTPKTYQAWLKAQNTE
jgi:SAP domain-containing protein